MKLAYLLSLLASMVTIVVSDRQGDALIDMKIKLKATGNQLPDWNPNQVNPCTWNSIICDNHYNVLQITLPYMGFNGILSPRIGELITLNVLSLPGNHITGEIPKEFGNLSSLTSLELENNRLTGSIPSSLGNLTKLQILILSQNILTGNIPDSLSNLPSLNDVHLAFNHLTGQIPDRLFSVARHNFTGNSLNCGAKFSLPCASIASGAGGSNHSGLGAILGSVGGAISLLFVAGVAFFMWKSKRKGYWRDIFVDVAGEDDRRIAFGQLKRFAWRELQIATDNFSDKNILGQGGFGKVYKGVLPDNTKIAVKRLTDYESPGGEAAFLREVELISVAVHRNLLRLIGFCTTPSERLLVYPFMQNLSVAYRLRVMHMQNAQLVVIVLTATTQVRGTMGHIAPEYLSTGKSSERADVFGCGIMLLELVTGQRAIDFSRLEEEDDVLLLDHAKKLVREKRLGDIIDRNMRKNYDGEEVEKMIQVALLCTQATPEDRPLMSEVVRMLEGEGLAERWEEWQQVEVTRRQEYERIHHRFDWGEDSIYNQDAIELSGGR